MRYDIGDLVVVQLKVGDLVKDKLNGELALIIDINHEYLLIQWHVDGWAGWVDKSYVRMVSSAI